MKQQNKTEVWASALTYMFSEDPNEVDIDNTIDKFMNRCFNISKEFTDNIDTEKVKDKELKEKLDKIMLADIFFHNLRFDGSFIISWLLKNNFKDEFTNLTKDTVLKLAKENNIPIDDSAFNSWAIESEWCQAKFIRQKTYIERIVNEDNTDYDVKCAGMGKRCKELFNMSLNKEEYNPDDMTYDELLFMKGLYRINNKPEIPMEELLELPDCDRTIDDFRLGLQIPSNIKAKQIDGGTLLTEYAYELRA